MSLRHSLLGLLALTPSTGYELTRKFDASLGTAWHASHSQVYPELGKLEERGMVEVVEEGARRSRTWAITDAGREELRRWLVDAEPDRRQRSETGVRWFLLLGLPPADRKAALERELAFMHEHAAGLERILALMEADGGANPLRPSVDLGLRTAATWRSWLEEQLEAAERELSG